MNIKFQSIREFITPVFREISPAATLGVVAVANAVFLFMVDSAIKRYLIDGTKERTYKQIFVTESLLAASCTVFNVVLSRALQIQIGLPFYAVATAIAVSLHLLLNGGARPEEPAVVEETQYPEMVNIEKEIVAKEVTFLANLQKQLEARQTENDHPETVKLIEKMIAESNKFLESMQKNGTLATYQNETLMAGYYQSLENFITPFIYPETHYGNNTIGRHQLFLTELVKKNGVFNSSLAWVEKRNAEISKAVEVRQTELHLLDLSKQLNQLLQQEKQKGKLKLRSVQTGIFIEYVIDKPGIFKKPRVETIEGKTITNDSGLVFNQILDFLKKLPVEKSAERSDCLDLLEQSKWWKTQDKSQALIEKMQEARKAGK